MARLRWGVEIQVQGAMVNRRRGGEITRRHSVKQSNSFSVHYCRKEALRGIGSDTRHAGSLAVNKDPTLSLHSESSANIPVCASEAGHRSLPGRGPVNLYRRQATLREKQWNELRYFNLLERPIKTYSSLQLKLRHCRPKRGFPMKSPWADSDFYC